jgi:hypothetical protein
LVFDKLRIARYFRNIVIQRLQPKMGSLHAISAPARSPFANLQGSQRAGALFLGPPGCPNSRISAAKAMSPADDFLQKQQKQRERRVKKGCGGNPLRGPRRSRNRSTRTAGLAPFCAGK